MTVHYQRHSMDRPFCGTTISSESMYHSCTYKPEDVDCKECIIQLITVALKFKLIPVETQKKYKESEHWQDLPIGRVPNEVKYVKIGDRDFTQNAVVFENLPSDSYGCAPSAIIVNRLDGCVYVLGLNKQWILIGRTGNA